MPHSILILQDDTPIRALLRAALEEQHDVVSVAATVGEALRLVRRRNFELLLAEVRRPALEGLSGLGLLQRAHPSLKLVVITSCAGPSDPFRSLQLRVHGRLDKPFDLATFHRVVERALGSRRPLGEHGRLLRRLVEGSWSLARRAGASLDQAQRRALEPDRDRLYRQYLRGICSGELQAGVALRLWDQLEALEQARQHAGSPGTVDWGKLRDGYRYVADLTVALGRAGRYEPVGERSPEQVPREVFAGLYGRLKRGEVSIDQLKRATLLRTADLETPGRPPEVRQLQRSLWGDGKEAGRPGGGRESRTGG